MLRGSLQVPGDKSITHRALIFSALTRGTSRIVGLSPAEDCNSTALCMRKLGVKIATDAKYSQMTRAVTVISPGLDQLTAPSTTLDCGNSGTTMRVMSGLVAGRPFKTRFDGDGSLRNRPMSRVLDPLSEMGMKSQYDDREGYAPFTIIGSKLKARIFRLTTASAQVQTALVLAGLQADAAMSISVPSTVRDHSYRLLKYMGAVIEQSGNHLALGPLTEPLPPFNMSVPADLSSAAFFMVAAACLPGSDITLKATGINPGRRLVINVLKEMGADIELEDEREASGEPIADIHIRGVKRLRGATIYSDDIASGIDEIPILALAGAMCDGLFIVRGAEELRHKESDRLAGITNNLRAAGVKIEDHEDGFQIEGTAKVPGGSPWETNDDHRLAMCGLIGSILFENELKVSETDSLKISYPNFQEHLQFLLAQSH